MAQLSAKISADTSEFKKAVGDAQKMLKAFTAEESATAQAMRKMYDVSQSQVNAFKKSVDAINKATDGTKNNKQASAALAKEIEKLRQQWDMLSNSAKNSKFGQNLSKTIKESEARMKSLNTQIAKTSANLKGTGGGGALSGLTTALQQQYPLVGNMVTQFGKFGPAVLAVAGAGKVLTDSFKMSESAMDGLHRSMSGLQTLYTDFVRSIRDGGLDFGNLAGSFGRGQDVYNAEDAYGSLMANNAAAYEKLKTAIDEAKLKVTEGGSLNKSEIDGLTKSVTDQYADIVNKKTDILNAKIKAAAAGSSDKEKLIQAYINADNADELLEKMKVDRAALLKQRGALKTEGYNFEDAYWEDKGKEIEYEKINAQYRVLDSIIESEAELQEVQKVNAEIVVLDRERVSALRDIAKLTNKSENNEKAAATEAKKRRDEERKDLEAEKKRREQAKKEWEKYAVDVNKIMSERMPGYSVAGSQSINNQMSTSIGNYKQNQAYKDHVVAAKKAKEETNAIFAKEFPKNTLSGLQSLSSETQNLYNTLSNLGNIENPFQAFDSIFGIAQNIMGVVDTVGSLGDALNKMSAISSATTATEIANTQAKIAANNTETASETVNATAKTFDAHAAIPFVGIAIAGAMVAAMIASIVASKSKTPKFANGAIISGPTLGLMGEYPGAQNNPEVVAPLNKLRGMLKDESSAGGEVQFRIDGRTLVGVLNKQNNYSSRQ